LNDDDKKTIDEVLELYRDYYDKMIDVPGLTEGSRHNVAAHLTLSHFLAKGIAIYSSWSEAVESVRPVPRVCLECGHATHEVGECVVSVPADMNPLARCRCGMP